MMTFIDVLAVLLLIGYVALVSGLAFMVIAVVIKIIRDR